MDIKGINGRSVIELQQEVNSGARFVVYQYCISIIVLSFRRSSDIYFIPQEKSAFVKGLPYTLISLLLGWWGLPWGIIYTIGSLVTNIGGGKDVTAEVMSFIQAQSSGAVFDFEKEVTPEEEQQLEKLLPNNHPGS